MLQSIAITVDMGKIFLAIATATVPCAASTACIMLAGDTRCAKALENSRGLVANVLGWRRMDRDLVDGSAPLTWTAADGLGWRRTSEHRLRWA